MLRKQQWQKLMHNIYHCITPTAYLAPGFSFITLNASTLMLTYFPGLIMVFHKELVTFFGVPGQGDSGVGHTFDILFEKEIGIQHRRTD